MDQMSEFDRFEEAVLTGDLEHAVGLWKSLAAPAGKRKQGSPKGSASAHREPKALAHDHPMEGLSDGDHDRHLRFHEEEFRLLQRQFVHEADPELKGECQRRMVACAQHWQKHRLTKHCPPPQEGEKLVKPEHLETAPDPLTGLPGKGTKKLGTEKPAKAQPQPLKKALDLEESGRRRARLFELNLLDRLGKSTAETASEKAGLMYAEVYDLYADLLEDADAVAAIEKALGDRPGDVVDFHGLRVRVENPAGSIRRGKNPARPWETVMRWPYGEIVGTEGVDGDPVDAFLGPDPTAPYAYVIHQHQIGEVLNWGGGTCPTCGHIPRDCPHSYDEDKIMLGFGSEEEAVTAFLLSYDDDRFLGPVDMVPVALLPEKLRERKGRIIKGLLDWVEGFLLTKALGMPKKHPFLKFHPDGTIHVKTPFKHEAFRAAMLSAIPKGDRKWNPDAGHWEVHPQHLHKVASLLHAYWDSSKHPKDAQGHFIKTFHPDAHPLEGPVKQALAEMSGQCDGAHEKDNVGFNGTDAGFGKDLAGKSSLSFKQTEAALHMLEKYKHTQLGHLADDLYGAGAKAKLAAMNTHADAIKQMAVEPPDDWEPEGAPVATPGAPAAPSIPEAAEAAPQAAPGAPQAPSDGETLATGLKTIPVSQWSKTKPWDAAKDYLGLNQLPEHLKGWKSHVLKLTPEMVAAHPALTPWEKEFLQGKIGKQASDLSYKQNLSVQKMMPKHKGWCMANPGVIPVIWQGLKDAQTETETAAQAKWEAATAKKAALVAEQSNTAWANPPGFDGSKLVDGELFSHQKAGANWLLTAKRGIIALATGLGKTASVISAFEKAREAGDAQRMAFVVPKGRLVGTVLDINQLFPGRKIVVLSGGSLGDTAEKFGPNVQVFTGKLEAGGPAWEAMQNADYVVTGYDPIRKYAEKFAEVCDTIACDEAVRLKGKDSQISKEVQAHFGKTPRLWYMSATPIPNSPMDLFQLVNQLDQTVFGTVQDFKKNHCLLQYNPHTKSYDITGYKDLGKTRAEVAHLIYHRNYESPDVKVVMPERNYKKTLLDMPEDQNQVYEAAKHAILEEVLAAGAAKFNPQNALTQLLRLEQISLTPRLLDPSYSGSEPKLEKAAQIARDHFAEEQESGHQPPKGIIFFSHFLGAQPFLREHLLKEAGLAQAEIATIQGSDYRVGGKKVKTIQDVVDAMNAGQCKALIASDAAMEGLNLQYGATKLVHLDTPWRPDALEQREGRIYRPGQQEVCQFERLLMNNTVEAKKDQTVTTKADNQAAIIEGKDVEMAAKFTFNDMLEALGAGGHHVKLNDGADLDAEAMVHWIEGGHQ